MTIISSTAKLQNADCLDERSLFAENATDEFTGCHNCQRQNVRHLISFIFVLKLNCSSDATVA